MRMMMQMTIPVEAGNEAARTGALGSTLKKIMETMKPEAAYFTSTQGERSGIFIFDMQDSSQIPAFAEPFFLAFGAKVTFFPVMSMEDLGKGLPGLEKAVKEFGGKR
jgi:Protein of unknown function (DUF3303)